MATTLRWNSYRYFPYERNLAVREVEALCGERPEIGDDAARVSVTLTPKVARRLTYFASVESSRGISSPDQARFEASFHANGSGASQSRRQVTRYSSHGLHEYRGKFNPQIVRAIGNILRLPASAFVLDPFCGSGTVLLESAHMGWDAVGIDSNPLAVEIAHAKLAAFHLSARELNESFEAVSLPLTCSLPPTDRAWTAQELVSYAGAHWEKALPNFGYLSKWFPISVLAQVSAILQAIDSRMPRRLRGIFRVMLSDILRSVSWQDPGDLRIRRRKVADENYPAVEVFLKSAGRKIRNMTALGPLKRGVRRAKQVAVLGDSRHAESCVAGSMRAMKRRRFDGAICSPPYATALPYIDTQRLSLCTLGMIAGNQIRHQERRLIGNREIATSERKELEQALSQNDAALSAGAIALCKDMLEAASDQGNGFRRKNMPALTYKYFMDMAQVFVGVARLLKKRAPFAMIVGQNQTHLGGSLFVIDTPQHLSEIAERNGFQVREIIELDTYQRFGIHHRNSIRKESLVVLDAV